MNSIVALFRRHGLLLPCSYKVDHAREMEGGEDSTLCSHSTPDTIIKRYGAYNAVSSCLPALRRFRQDEAPVILSMNCLMA